MKMEKYSLLCILLFTMIIGSQTVPHNTDKRSSKDSMQKDPGAGNMGHDIGEIMFPDEMPQTRTHARKDFSAEGKGIDCIEGVCLGAQDYPSQDIIEAVVKKLHGSVDLNGEYIGKYFDSKMRIKPGDPEQEELCASQVYTEYPKSIKNDQNMSKYIINAGNHKQGIIYETCVNGADCKKDASFPEGYTTTCVQKYSKIRLWAIDTDSAGTPEPAFDSFIVPSCCVCAFTKTKV